MIQVKRLESGSVVARLIVHMPRSVDDLATLHDLQYAFDRIAINSGGFLRQERLLVESAGKNTMSEISNDIFTVLCTSYIVIVRAKNAISSWGVMIFSTDF